MGIRTAVTTVGALTYAFTIPTLIDEYSLAVAAVPAVLFTIIAGTNDLTSRLPDNLPSTGSLVMVASCGILGMHWAIVGVNGTLMLTVMGAFGFVVGLVAYFLGTVAARLIGASVLGVDLKEKQRQERIERTGDPYGDPHAARILNDDEAR